MRNNDAAIAIVKKLSTERVDAMTSKEFDEIYQASMDFNGVCNAQARINDVAHHIEIMRIHEIHILALMRSVDDSPCIESCEWNNDSVTYFASLDGARILGMMTALLKSSGQFDDHTFARFIK